MLKGDALVREVVRTHQKVKDFSDIKPGDAVVVSIKVKEGEKERLQSFKGVVIRLQGRGHSRSFTVRKMAAGNVGVERTFPFSSPSLESIKRLSSGHVRRAKLYYLRALTGKKARIASELLVPSAEGENKESQNSEGPVNVESGATSS